MRCWSDVLRGYLRAESCLADDDTLADERPCRGQRSCEDQRKHRGRVEHVFHHPRRGRADSDAHHARRRPVQNGCGFRTSTEGKAGFEFRHQHRVLFWQRGVYDPVYRQRGCSRRGSELKYKGSISGLQRYGLPSAKDGSVSGGIDNHRGGSGCLADTHEPYSNSESNGDSGNQRK